jgi:hypothetical protein
VVYKGTTSSTAQQQRYVETCIVTFQPFSLFGDTCKQLFSLNPHQFQLETKLNNGIACYMKAHDNNRILTVHMQLTRLSTTLKRVRFQGTYRKRNFYLLKSYLHHEKKINIVSETSEGRDRVVRRE